MESALTMWHFFFLVTVNALSTSETHLTPSLASSSLSVSSSQVSLSPITDSSTSSIPSSSSTILFAPSSSMEALSGDGEKRSVLSTEYIVTEESQTALASDVSGENITSLYGPQPSTTKESNTYSSHTSADQSDAVTMSPWKQITCCRPAFCLPHHSQVLVFQHQAPVPFLHWSLHSPTAHFICTACPYLAQGCNIPPRHTWYWYWSLCQRPTNSRICNVFSVVQIIKFLVNGVFIPTFEWTSCIFKHEDTISPKGVNVTVDSYLNFLVVLYSSGMRESGV